MKHTKRVIKELADIADIFWGVKGFAENGHWVNWMRTTLPVDIKRAREAAAGASEELKALYPGARKVSDFEAYTYELPNCVMAHAMHIMEERGRVGRKGYLMSLAELEKELDTKAEQGAQNDEG